MKAYEKFAAGLILGTSLAAQALAAFAATLVVDNDFADCRQADFSSIQAAVAAAEPGDKILVCPGVYLETVEVTNPDLRIEAQAAPGEVVLQGTPSQPFGFRLLNTTGVLVQGFTVQGFSDANIRIEGGSGNILRKNITTAAIGSGIRVINSSANVVEQNTSFANQGGGITVTSTVTAPATSDNIIRHNETYSNGQVGLQILITPPAVGTLSGNVMFGNDSHDNPIGIRNVQSAHGSAIENNRVFSNNWGIIVGLSRDVTVRNNRTERNTEFGIRLQNGANNSVVEKNEVFHNTQDGIRLEGGPIVVANNMVQLNHVRRNGRDGVRAFPNSAGNTIERNVIRESGEHDAHDDSKGPGTSGTANFWINNKCETDLPDGLCKNH
jgi:parallel beta-helix repeat protein